MAPSHPEEGSTLSAKFKVLPTDLASATDTSPNANSHDNYAHVLATPRLVSFMEIMCARMLLPYLASDQLSVGVRVEMDHLAATPVDEIIEVEAKFVGKDKKFFVFETTIRDAGGEVGRGKCVRAVIDEGRLMEGARKRVGGGGKL